MSTYIVDRALAVRFTPEAINAALGENNFYSDQFLFFEEGGDNNVTTVDRITGRERRHRSWKLIAIGDHCSIMRKIIHLSAGAEGGCMRFASSSSTTPESYIRHNRKIIQTALAYEKLAQPTPFTLSVKIPLDEIPPDYQTESYIDYHNKQAAKIRERAGLLSDETCITIHPLASIHGAATLFSTIHMTTRAIEAISELHCYSDRIPTEESELATLL